MKNEKTMNELLQEFHEVMGKAHANERRWFKDNPKDFVKNLRKYIKISKQGLYYSDQLNKLFENIALLSLKADMGGRS